ncbi:hypothetical protein [Rhodocyclus tenuis]|uniref:Uncharacterized protein n=1 Tax=Rhodocyclus tenuis TaxID=1066 RepID=A0A840G9T7_RHOTE|nr:hypothetical protein [Rhodocyclus tenuis]MBB4249093.1 hypothetical protein [Rhodocyclus tenuis]
MPLAGLNGSTRCHVPAALLQRFVHLCLLSFFRRSNGAFGRAKMAKRFFDLQEIIDRFFDDGWLIFWSLD